MSVLPPAGKDYQTSEAINNPSIKPKLMTQKRETNTKLQELGQ